MSKEHHNELYKCADYNALLALRDAGQKNKGKLAKPAHALAHAIQKWVRRTKKGTELTEAARNVELQRRYADLRQKHVHNQGDNDEEEDDDGLERELAQLTEKVAHLIAFIGKDKFDKSSQPTT